MRITGKAGARPSPYSVPKGRRTESGPGWEKYLDVEAQKRKMEALPEGGSLGSVFMQFEDDYKAWKAGQPELALPEAPEGEEPRFLVAGEVSAVYRREDRTRRDRPKVTVSQVLGRSLAFRAGRKETKAKLCRLEKEIWVFCTFMVTFSMLDRI